MFSSAPGGGDSKSSSAAARPTVTSSQSSATATFLSAVTRSKPLPHVTTSLNAGLLMTSNKSLSGPPERVSLEASRKGPSIQDVGASFAHYAVGATPAVDQVVARTAHQVV